MTEPMWCFKCSARLNDYGNCPNEDGQAHRDFEWRQAVDRVYGGPSLLLAPILLVGAIALYLLTR